MVHYVHISFPVKYVTFCVDKIYLAVTKNFNTRTFVFTFCLPDKAPCCLFGSAQLAERIILTWLPFDLDVQKTTCGWHGYNRPRTWVRNTNDWHSVSRKNPRRQHRNHLPTSADWATLNQHHSTRVSAVTMCLHWLIRPGPSHHPHHHPHHHHPHGHHGHRGGHHGGHGHRGGHHRLMAFVFVVGTMAVASAVTLSSFVATLEE